MSDEMQVQAQRPSATPYVLGGAVVGTGAGLVTNNLVRKTSVDDLIKEATSRDAFTSNTADSAKNVTEWKDVYTQAEEVKKAEQALEEAKKPVLADNSVEVKNLNAAQEARQKEFDRLFEIESKKGGEVRSLPDKKAIKEGLTGDAGTVSRDWQRYITTLEPEYKTAVNTAKGTKAYTDIKAKSDAFNTKLDSYYDEVFKAYTEKDPRKRAKAIKDLEKKVKFANAEYTAKSNKELLEQAYKDGNMHKVDKRWYASADYTRTWTDKHGKVHTEYYKFNDGIKLKDLRRAETDRIRDLKTSLIDEIEASHEAFVGAKQEVDAFGKRTEFKPTGKKGGKNSNYVCDFATLKSAKLEEMQKDQEVVRKILDGEKLSKTEKARKAKLAGTYGLDPDKTGEIKKLQANIEQRIALKEEFTGLDDALKAAKGGQARVAHYKDAMEEVIQKDKGVKKAADKIRKLAEKHGINVETTVKDEAAIREAVEEKLKGSSVQQKLDDAIKAHSDALGKKGAVNEEAVKQATSKLDDAKAALKSKADDLAGKMKGGTKQQKLIAAGIGLAAGIGAALMIRPKNKVQA